MDRKTKVKSTHMSMVFDDKIEIMKDNWGAAYYIQNMGLMV